MSDEDVNPAKQKNTHVFDGIANEPGLSSPVYDDAELVHRAQKDDPWAIEQLVLRYQKKVYAIAYRMLSGDAEEAKDRTQDAFLQVFRKIKQFKGKSSFYTWLCRIVINTCIDAHRSGRRRHGIFSRPFENSKEETAASFLEGYADTDKNSDPLSAVSRKQLESDIKSAMTALSEKQRTIFQLKVFHEMRISEIAKIMGLAQGTVKTHLFRATRFIQKQLKGWTEV